MAEFASNAKGNTGVALGATGLGLGGLALLGGNGILGNIFGGNNCGCSENMAINRYELGQEQKIAELTSEKKLLEATIYTDGKLNDFRNYVDSKFAGVDARMNAQDVYNATNTATINCVSSQIACLQNVLNGITKTVVPITAVCPEPMKLYNSWTAPTTTTGA